MNIKVHKMIYLIIWEDNFFKEKILCHYKFSKNWLADIYLIFSNVVLDYFYYIIIAKFNVNNDKMWLFKFMKCALKAIYSHCQFYKKVLLIVCSMTSFSSSLQFEMEYSMFKHLPHPHSYARILMPKQFFKLPNCLILSLSLL